VKRSWNRHPPDIVDPRAIPGDFTFYPDMGNCVGNTERWKYQRIFFIVWKIKLFLFFLKPRILMKSYWSFNHYMLYSNYVCLNRDVLLLSRLILLENEINFNKQQRFLELYRFKKKTVLFAFCYKYISSRTITNRKTAQPPSIGTIRARQACKRRTLRFRGGG